MTFTPPTKCTTGQCSDECQWRRDALGPTTDHLSDCPALSPLQPQPGDEPDTLTKLTRIIRASNIGYYEGEQALAIISEAAEERKVLEYSRDVVTRQRDDAQKDRDSWRSRWSGVADRLEAALRERDEALCKGAAQQETINTLSGKTTEALRMGQQQGRVELAEEVAAFLTTNGHKHLPAFLRRIVDGEH